MNYNAERFVHASHALNLCRASIFLRYEFCQIWCGIVDASSIFKLKLFPHQIVGYGDGKNE